MKKYLAAAAGALALAFSAAPAGAVEIFDNIDQAVLNLFGTEHFGVTTNQLGDFTHAFSFMTTGVNNASSSVVTISLNNGAADIDFSAIDLDGFAFTQHIFDPSAETWDLTGMTLAAGSHTITLHGTVITAPASYAGTLNVAAVPEPATWALMISGFGAAGAMLRRRRSVATAA